MLLLSIIMLVAAGVRFYQLDHLSLWVDEFISVEISAGHGYEHLDLSSRPIIQHAPDLTTLDPQRGYLDVLRSMDRSTHPPLYFCLLRLWRQIMPSDSDASIRALSAVISLLGLLAAFDAVRTLHGRRTALWAVAVLTLANPQIEFAQEARGYSLLVALMFASCAVMARLVRFGATWRRIALLFLATTAMIFTHYLGFSVLASVAIYGAIALKNPSDKKRVLLTLLASVLIFAFVWSPILILQLSSFSHHLAWMNEGSEGRFSRVFTRLVSLPLQFFSDAGKNPTLLSYASIVLLILPAFLLRKRPHLLIWCLIMWINVFTLAGSDVARSTFALSIRRYTLPAAGAACVVATILMRSLPGKMRIVAPALLVLSCACAIPLPYYRSKPNWRALARYVSDETAHDGAIVFYPHPTAEDWYGGMLYLGVSRYAHNIDRPIVVLTDRAGETLQRKLDELDPILIVSGSMSGDSVFPHSTVMQTSPFPFICTCSRVELLPSHHHEQLASQSPTFTWQGRGDLHTTRNSTGNP